MVDTGETRDPLDSYQTLHLHSWLNSLYHYSEQRDPAVTPEERCWLAVILPILALRLYQDVRLFESWRGLCSCAVIAWLATSDLHSVLLGASPSVQSFQSEHAIGSRPLTSFKAGCHIAS